MDQTLFHLINEQWANPALDLFMAAISDSAIWLPLFIAIALLVIVFGRFRGRAFLICLLLSLVIAEGSTSILKSAFARHRPKQAQSVRMVALQKTRPEFLTLFKKPLIRYSDQTDLNRSGPSFPSGHTTDNTVIALCLTLFYPRRGWWYWIITAAIGYSRVYLGAHWPSDVIGTLFLAAGETLFLLGGFELLWRWAAPKWWPQMFAQHPNLIAGSTR